MKYIRSLKQKSFLMIGITISITVFITYSILSVLYYDYHEYRVKTELTKLLEKLEQNLSNIHEAKDWLYRNVDMTLYLFEDAEDLVENIPFETNDTKILSTHDREQLENGQIVVKKMAITYLDHPALTLTYPILENGIIKQLLFIYYPIINQSVNSIILLLCSLIFIISAAGATFIFAKQLFGKSFHQLKDIKQAAIEISNGNYDSKIWKSSTDEIGEVTEVFNMMSDALKDNQQRTKEFIEDISHEIKTPLTYIKTYNQALLDGIIQEKDDQTKCYRLIDRETNRLQKLIQNFLDFSKLDSQVVELNKQPIVFAQSIEDIMMKYEPIFTENNIQLNMTLNYDVIIDADEERIEQVIQNIVQNAIRYSKNEPCIRLSLEKQEDTCILAISDNGTGISKEHLSIITNRFIRVNKVRSRKESGTGIGLSIVEKLMTLHKGEMVIESELNVGTTVKLVFPLYEKAN